MGGGLRPPPWEGQPLPWASCVAPAGANHAWARVRSPGRCHGSRPGVRRVCPGCMPGVCRVYAGCTPGVRRVYAGCMPGVYRVYATG